MKINNAPDSPTEKAEIILNRIAPAITPEILGYSLYAINKDAKQKRNKRNTIKDIIYKNAPIKTYLPDNFDLIDNEIDYKVNGISTINNYIKNRLKSIPDMYLNETEQNIYKEKLSSMREMVVLIKSTLHKNLIKLRIEINNIYKIKKQILEIFGTPTNQYTNFGSNNASYPDNAKSDYVTDEIGDNNNGFTADDFICQIFKIHNYEFHYPVLNHDEIIDNPNAVVAIATEDIESNVIENKKLNNSKISKKDLKNLIKKAKSILERRKQI